MPPRHHEARIHRENVTRAADVSVAAPDLGPVSHWPHYGAGGTRAPNSWRRWCLRPPTGSVECHGYKHDRKYREQQGYRRVMRSGRFEGGELALGLFLDLAQVLPRAVHELPVPADSHADGTNDDSEGAHGAQRTTLLISALAHMTHRRLLICIFRCNLPRKRLWLGAGVMTRRTNPDPFGIKSFTPNGPWLLAVRTGGRSRSRRAGR